jgi:hypothetical protein
MGKNIFGVKLAPDLVESCAKQSLETEEEILAQQP